jgi:hypothetical protein
LGGPSRSSIGAARCELRGTRRSAEPRRRVSGVFEVRALAGQAQMSPPWVSSNDIRRLRPHAEKSFQRSTFGLAKPRPGSMQRKCAGPEFADKSRRSGHGQTVCVRVKRRGRVERRPVARRQTRADHIRAHERACASGCGRWSRLSIAHSLTHPPTVSSRK